MQCHQARHRLAQYGRDKIDIATDPELIDHLRTCPDCAEDLAAEKTLGRFLASAGADDTTDMLPFAGQKAQVESRAANQKAKARKWTSIVFGPLGGFIRRPAPAVGSVLAVIVMAVITLIPFKYHHTVGYTITMDGVDGKLAGDIDRICSMLTTMGLEDALVDIIGCDISCGKIAMHECDTTCCLVIAELKTREEAERVAAAFAQYDTYDMTTSIQPIRARTSGTLLDHAHETLLQRRPDIN